MNSDKRWKIGILTLVCCVAVSAFGVTTIPVQPLDMYLGRIEKSVTIVAILVGGIWALYHYFRGRKYISRLEPKTSGVVFRRGDNNYLLVRASLKNCGVSKVEITRRGTGVLISGLVSALDSQDHTSTQTIEKEELGFHDLFLGHTWIESTETIYQDQLIRLPDEPYVAIELITRVIHDEIAFTHTSVVRTDLNPKETPKNDVGKTGM